MFMVVNGLQIVVGTKPQFGKTWWGHKPTLVKNKQKMPGILAARLIIIILQVC